MASQDTGNYRANVTSEPQGRSKGLLKPASVPQERSKRQRALLDATGLLKKAFKEMDATEKKLKELDEELARIEEERKRILTSGLNN